MTNNLWKLKIQAFLHDPPEKAIILMRGQSHESRASELLNKLIGDGSIPDLVKTVENADRIAAASSRVVVNPGQKGGTQLQIRFHEHPVLIHPLSGREFNLRHYGGPLVHYDLNGDDTVLRTAGEAVTKAVDELKKEHGSDLKGLFFALWRLLPEQLAKSQEGEAKSRLGLLWYLLPADTRTPDHSIWDHLSMTAAVASTLPNPAFLLFAIGPVQSFISTARRTQDLWMGSYLLSYLNWCAAKAVVERIGPDAIIFPNLWRQPLVDHWLSQEFGFEVEPSKDQLLIANFPNRFLAIVPEAKAEEIANDARKALMDEWGKIWHATREHINKRIEERGIVSLDNKWSDLWEKQTKDFFETYWVVYPWCLDGRPEKLLTKESAEALIGWYEDLLGEDALSARKGQDLRKIISTFTSFNPLYVNIGTVYQLLYDLTERALGARKTLRDFNHTEEHGYKCALCGEREALRTESGFPGIREGSLESKIRSFWNELSQIFPGDFKKGGGERLCAICVTKRLAFDAYFKETLGLGDQRFPSTSSVAVAPFQIALLEAVKQNASLRDAFRNYVQRVAELKETLGINWRANSVYQAWGLVQNPEFPAELRETAEKFLHTDGDFLFEETFEPNHLEREFLPANTEQVRDAAHEAKEALRKLLDETKEIPKPSRYMAVLAADGDSMGEWLSGEKAPTIAETIHPRARIVFEEGQPLSEVGAMRRLLSPFLHNAISASLRDFSTRVVRYVIENRHGGKLIYAGGDDLLALVPKAKAVAAARDIRMLYSGVHLAEASQRLESENGFVKFDDELLRMMSEKATLSVGIAIAHHSHSLGDAVHKAHEMLDEHAKKRKGKNSLAIASVRRSGGPRIAEAPWLAPESSEVPQRESISRPSPVEVLLEFQQHFEEETLSPRFVYALGGEIADGLKGVDDKFIGCRVRYLLGRHIELPRREGQSLEEWKRQKEELVDKLSDRLMRDCLAPLRSTSPTPQLDELLHLLELAVFLAREERA